MLREKLVFQAAFMRNHEKKQQRGDENKQRKTKNNQTKLHHNI